MFSMMKVLTTVIIPVIVLAWTTGMPQTDYDYDDIHIKISNYELFTSPNIPISH